MKAVISGRIEGDGGEVGLALQEALGKAIDKHLHKRGPGGRAGLVEFDQSRCDLAQGLRAGPRDFDRLGHVERAPEGLQRGAGVAGAGVRDGDIAQEPSAVEWACHRIHAFQRQRFGAPILACAAATAHNA